MMRRVTIVEGLGLALLLAGCGARVTPTDLAIRGENVVLVGSEGSFRLSDNCVGSGTNFGSMNFCSKDPLSEPEIRFEPPGVLEVVRVESDPEYPSEAWVYAKALQPGMTTATFSARLDGSTYTKVQEVRAAFPTEVTGDFCDGKPFVATAEPVILGLKPQFEGQAMAMRRMSEEAFSAVIGWEPADALVFEPVELPNGLWFPAVRGTNFRGNGEFVASHVPDFRAPFRVIDPVEVDEISVRSSAGFIADHLNLRAATVYVEISASGEEVCGEGMPIVWRSLTPDICKPFLPFGEPADEVVRKEPFNIAIYEDGTCLIDATPLTDAEGAITHTLEMSVSVDL